MNPRQYSITREQAERVADLFEAHGKAAGLFHFCPFTSGPALEDTKRRYIGGKALWVQVPAIVEAVAGFSDAWTLDVADALRDRSAARYIQQQRDAVEALDVAEPIKAFLRGQVGQRGMCKPEAKAYPVKPGKGYVPAGECTLRLQGSKAVSYYYAQESYADHSRSIVPCEGAIPSDLSACRANLSRLCASWRTHNGFAGSGCTYGAELHVVDGVAWVVFDCRASISD